MNTKPQTPVEHYTEQLLQFVGMSPEAGTAVGRAEMLKEIHSLIAAVKCQEQSRIRANIEAVRVEQVGYTATIMWACIAEAVDKAITKN